MKSIKCTEQVCGELHHIGFEHLRNEEPEFGHSRYTTCSLSMLLKYYILNKTAVDEDLDLDPALELPDLLTQVNKIRMSRVWDKVCAR